MSVTGRAAVWRALRVLVASPALLGAVLLAAVVGRFATRASLAAAGIALRNGHAAGALGLLSLGLTVGALLVASALASTLAASSDPLRGALSRGVAILSLQALERFLYFTLLGGLVVVSLKLWASGRDGFALRFAATSLAPFAVVVIALPAFRVAIAAVGSGVAAPEAFVRGLAVALSRLPGLVRLAMWILLASAPLWLASLVLARATERVSAPTAIFLDGARAAIALFAVAWSYRALALWLDGDVPTNDSDAVVGGAA